LNARAKPPKTLAEKTLMKIVAVSPYGLKSYKPCKKFFAREFPVKTGMPEVVLLLSREKSSRSCKIQVIDQIGELPLFTQTLSQWANTEKVSSSVSPSGKR
jgi:hypothetical protein